MIDRVRQGISRRARTLAAEVRCRFAAQVLRRNYIRYGRTKMLVSRDGDEQETIYHANFRRWRETERRFFAAILRPGDRAIDVGANMGFLALIFSELVGPEGRVFCFEPCGRTFAKLQTMIALNDARNCIPFQLGCGAERGQARLSTGYGSSGSFSMAAPAADGAFETVDVVRLDDTDAARSTIALVKIDVEGFEPSVLQGASRLLARDRPRVFIELGADHPRSSAEAAALLAGYRYRLVHPRIEATEEIDWRAMPAVENYLWEYAP